MKVEKAKRDNPNYQKFMRKVQANRYREIFKNIEHELPKVKMVSTDKTMH